MRPRGASPNVYVRDLRHVVDLYAPVEALDDYGTASKTGLKLGTFRAFVEDLGGPEVVIAEQLRADSTHRVTMRWPGAGYSVTAQHWLVYRGRRLDIKSVSNVDNHNRMITLLCNEVTTP